ncbi:MAG: hypothetical protein AAGD14_10880 [Planctomycetota bacterium]
MRFAWLGAIFLAACGGGGGAPAAVPFTVAVQSQPSDALAGETLAPFRVRAEEANGRTVTLSLAERGTLPAGRVDGLTGTLRRVVRDGFATFDDIRLTGAAEGYRFRIAGGGSEVVTDAFTIRASDAFRLAFFTSPGDTPAGSAMDPFLVAYVDRFDNLVEGATATVTVDVSGFDAFGRELLLHANADTLFELVDTRGPFTTPPEADLPPGRVEALAFDEDDTQLAWGTTEDRTLFSYDPVLGGGVVVRGTLTRRYKGLYFADGVLWGLPHSGAAEHAIDIATADDTSGGSFPIDLPGTSILGFRGAAVDPVTGDLFVAADTGGATPLLLEVDLDNNARSRGTLAEGCASLATVLDNERVTLYAASPGPDPALHTVDPLTARMTLVQRLGGDDEAQALTYLFPAPIDILDLQLEADPVDGIARIGGWRWNLMVEGVRLVADAAGLQPGFSNPFDITAPDTSFTVSFARSEQTITSRSGSFELVASAAAPHALTVLVDDVARTIPPGTTRLTVPFTLGAAENERTFRITGVSLGGTGATALHTVRFMP